jgi:hypothetical protein
MHRRQPLSTHATAVRALVILGNDVLTIAAAWKICERFDVMNIRARFCDKLVQRPCWTAHV